MKKVLLGLVVAVMMTVSGYADVRTIDRNFMKGGYDLAKICVDQTVFIVVQNDKGIAITDSDIYC